MDNYNGENGVWRTISGRKVFIKDGQSLESAMAESGKFQNLNNSLDKGLNELDYEEVKSIYDKTNDPSIRGKLMDKLQEKDPYRTGKDIYGIDMKPVEYKESFEEAIKKVNEMNKDKEYITDTVYHGTNANFEKFNYDNFGKTDTGDFGQGIYTTKNKETAAKYGNNIKEVNVQYKNPLILNNDQDFSNFYNRYGDEFGEAKQMYNSEQVAVSIMNMGYDAIIDNVYGQTVVYDTDNLNIKK